jgi:3-hydroxypropionyl-CoA synthetase (ADP-forming)
MILMSKLMLGCVVTVDQKFGPDLLRSCCKRGIHNTLVVILGEGREGRNLGEAGDIEEQIKEFSSKLRVRIIEPNCTMTGYQIKK